MWYIIAVICQLKLLVSLTNILLPVSPLLSASIFHESLSEEYLMLVRVLCTSLQQKRVTACHYLFIPPQFARHLHLIEISIQQDSFKSRNCLHKIYCIILTSGNDFKHAKDI